jgi:long-chain acyl-CoA synthetase
MIALREKRLGIWNEVSWEQYRDAVIKVGEALELCGVKAGDGVGILSDNRSEWLYADLGAQLLGARSVGIYQTNPPEDVAYVLNDSACTIIFCEDQEQVDKAVEIVDQTPTVKRVVVFDPRGTRDIEDERLISWSDFLALAESTTPVEERLALLDPDAAAMVIYTSGTTGAPKGALISSRNVLETSNGVNQMLAVGPGDSVLSYLPLCHVAEKIFSLFVPLTSGAVVHFGESIETVQTDLREVAPTVFLGVPRIWEKMYSGVSVKMQDASWLKRTLFAWATKVGASKAAGPLMKLKRAMANALVFWPLQERLGMRRCRIAISGAAPIGKDLLGWYHGIGLPILEGYGMTECAGTSHINPPGRVKLGTVGITVPLVDCELGEDGEVLLRGPNVFLGYLGREQATRESIDSEGWLHTGDIGAIDDEGYLSITGRKKEIIITSGGKNLSPEKIENALKTSPFIKEAIAIGDQRKFISALVQVEFDILSNWATRQKIAYTSFADLSSRDEVVKLIDEEIRGANDKLARVEQVREFRLLDKELSQDDGELTATQKVRRGPIMEAYESLIEEIYRGGA